MSEVMAYFLKNVVSFRSIQVWTGRCPKLGHTSLKILNCLDHYKFGQREEDQRKLLTQKKNKKDVRWETNEITLKY